MLRKGQRDWVKVHAPIRSKDLGAGDAATHTHHWNVIEAVTRREIDRVLLFRSIGTASNEEMASVGGPETVHHRPDLLLRQCVYGRIEFIRRFSQLMRVIRRLV